MAHLVHVNIYLASQAHFAALNAVYKSIFGVDPPSRACVAARLDAEQECLLLDAAALDDGICYTSRTEKEPQTPIVRRALHVQGRSHWAAANIGPYSQAMDARGRIFVAGQIGLRPTTLELAPSPAKQATLALQHARRIFQAVLESRTDRRQGWVEGCVCWLSDAKWLSMAQAIWSAQTKVYADEEEEEPQKDGWEKEWLGAGLHVAQIPTTFVILGPQALPRHAVAEWQLSAHSGDVYKEEIEREEGEEENSEDEDEDREATFAMSKGHLSIGTYGGPWQAASSRRGRSQFGILHLRTEHGRHFENAQTPRALFARAFTVRLLYANEACLQQGTYWFVSP